MLKFNNHYNTKINNLKAFIAIIFVIILYIFYFEVIITLSIHSRRAIIHLNIPTLPLYHQ